MIILTAYQVDELCIFIENQLEKNNCDHSLKHSTEWAIKNGIDIDDFHDLLAEHGGNCDCEVIMNLPENCDISIEEKRIEKSYLNPYQIPEKYVVKEDKTYTKVLFSDRNYSYHNYLKSDDILIPAIYGEKTKKRIRSNVHFFKSIKSGLPTELGFVKEFEEITAKKFSEMVKSENPENKEFSEKVADYYLSSIEKIAINKPMGIYYSEHNDLGGKRIKLKIHKVIIKN
ncbi:DUF2695 domain-containing protein [Flammeovirga sp. OC4]|uniref:DUF2695 domain-containing protein n=1 Tax=Flammeovirga sp. OC4 TaxID=1382345 RepID=UPI0005C72E67|nr:DUF2695 domain-containing protein [Flammeovirga sp. OC4]